MRFVSLVALSSLRGLDVLEYPRHGEDARDVVPGVMIAASLTFRQP